MRHDEVQRGAFCPSPWHPQAILGLYGLSAFARRHRAFGIRRQRYAGPAAHGRGQIYLLSSARPALRRALYCGVAAHRPDERPSGAASQKAYQCRVHLFRPKPTRDRHHLRQLRVWAGKVSVPLARAPPNRHLLGTPQKNESGTAGHRRSALYLSMGLRFSSALSRNCLFAQLAAPSTAHRRNGHGHRNRKRRHTREAAIPTAAPSTFPKELCPQQPFLFGIFGGKQRCPPARHAPQSARYRRSVCRHAQTHQGSGTALGQKRHQCRLLPRRLRQPRARPQAGRLDQQPHPRDCGHQCLWYGHRQTRRALGGTPRLARNLGSLLPRGGECRTRRAKGLCRGALRQRRHPTIRN